ncbi:MAG: 3-phosphoshikimate 1-carboxyvinyltransferase [Gemmatimonadetes bacterium]|nr:MAG: 3-phosphoshikimate 1-carboxyvinyltransferase [Gemmatimonadota bacterium]
MKVAGTVRVPGDKSISHRALMLAALTRGGEGGGRCELTGLLTGEDVKSTARVLRRMGAVVSTVRDGVVVTVRGGRLSRPGGSLDCGNSGTTARLTLGLLAGQRFPARAMGAHIEEEGGDTLPLRIRGGRLTPLDYTSPVASAQVKSALLFAGLTGGVPVTVREPYRSRDHTERLLVHLGLQLRVDDTAVSFVPSDRRSAIPPFRLVVPGDISSAAFLVAAAVLADGGELLLENVGVNPTRTGFLVVLERMGARVARLNLSESGGEAVADLLVRPARLVGTEVAAAEIPTLVDEVPVLAVLASRARGETVFRDVGELRVKESNRLELIAANLRTLGGAAEARGNDLYVAGTPAPPRGRVDTAGDHRLAMAFAVLGTVPGGAVRLSERASVAISYPGFFSDLRRIQATGNRQRVT